ncbi:MAG: hypothetical protein ACYDD1_23335 [Caulobacteraceae bacterium]
MTDTQPVTNALRVRTPDDNWRGPSGHGGDDVRDTPDDGQAISRLHELASHGGDISELLSETELASLGAMVIDDWHRDNGERDKWKAEVKSALEDASQDARDYDGQGSNVRYPALTLAARGFADRAYPALIKGDQTVGMKRIGSAPRAPQQIPPPPQGSAPQLVQQFQAAQQQATQEFQAATKAWQNVDDRAKRVAAYLNYQLFYASGGDWETDMDVLLNQLPVTGSAFKKVFWDPLEKRVCSELVHAMRLTIPMNARSVEKSPRATQDYDIYPYEVEEGQRSGKWRKDAVILIETTDAERSRVFVEQHRMHDLDGDGMSEPYIVTVDVESQTVMRVEAAFDTKDVQLSDDEEPIATRIERWCPFVPFTFMPDMNGRIYAIGFGKLMADLSAVTDTTINQLMDAGADQVEGGGFIGSGLRLQGAGQSSTLRWRRGEYKVVNSAGGPLRESIWERPLPGPSAVLRDLLNILLEANKDIGNVKDILSGDTPSTAPVGTTLAVANQALQPFSAIFKRLYRSSQQEYRKIYELIAKYGVGDPDVEKEYMRITGAQRGEFEADFAGPSADVQPVADPTVVTQQQAMARAQVGVGLLQNQELAPLLDKKKIVSDVLEAAQYDDPDSYIVPPPPPNPMDAAKVADTQASAQLKNAQAAAARAAALKSTGQGVHITELARQAAVNHEHPQDVREHEGLVSVAQAAALHQLGGGDDVENN